MSHVLNIELHPDFAHPSIDSIPLLDLHFLWAGQVLMPAGGYGPYHRCIVVVRFFERFTFIKSGVGSVYLPDRSRAL